MAGSRLARCRKAVPGWTGQNAKEPAAPLGKTGATVLGLALMVLALGAGAMVVRSVKAGRR
ncbi:MAG: hypothetical protein EGS39_03765 [Bifidobacterium bifidum]|uniref:hypothetical protein n=1 Tax=Bifidobacterium bifidum TaxID=1681 RepID=UPI0020B33C5D|nr:hypothetical protein [Bifidobacterium bifidum]MBD9265113.1 hypothetical protein [Bifidobacterium bifidum]